MNTSKKQNKQTKETELACAKDYLKSYKTKFRRTLFQLQSHSWTLGNLGGKKKKDVLIKLSCKALTSTHKHLFQVSITQNLKVLLLGVEWYN